MVSFKDAPVEILDGDRGINYPKKTDFANYGYCIFLNTGNVTKTGFVFNSTDFISKKRDALLKKGKLRLYDIVLTTRGTVGNVGFYSKNIQYSTIRINSGMVIIRANEKIICPYYLYLFFRSNLFKKQIMTNSSGSAQPQLPISSLNNIQILLPSLLKQTQIAIVLSDLDAKIELNNEINQQLEAMAKTLYDYWFVQFDFPDANGNLYKSSGGKMVYDKKLKREIPEGWEVAPLKQYAVFSNGKGVKKINLDDNGKYYVYGSNGKIGKTNDVLFKKPVIAVGRVGANYGEVHYSINPCWISDNAVTSQAKIPENIWWLLHMLKSINYSNIAGGSAQPLITQGKLKELLFAVPNENLLNNFYNNVNSLFLLIQSNSEATQQLTKLRDWLLPMLMNGQVTVKKFEEEIQMNMAAEPMTEYKLNEGVMK